MIVHTDLYVLWAIHALMKSIMHAAARRLQLIHSANKMYVVKCCKTHKLACMDRLFNLQPSLCTNKQGHSIKIGRQKYACLSPYIHSVCTSLYRQPHNLSCIPTAAHTVPIHPACTYEPLYLYRMSSVM
jgi:hypothetical protein